jgi:starvation-inducible DNA-binding protein
VQSVNQQSMRIGKTAAAVAGGNSLNTVALLEQLLIQSIRLRDLYMNARWQVADGQFGEIRRMLHDHKKEQISLIGLLVDRILNLGGAARVFASDFLQSTQFCRAIRGPRALNQLLLDLLEAHEAVLSAAHPHESYDDLHRVRDFAVGQVVLTNEQQWEIINGKVRTAGPQQRLLETETSRLYECE